MLGHTPLSTKPLSTPGDAQDTIIVLGLANEANSVLSLSAARLYAMGQSEETDSILQASPTRRYGLGLSEETDSAFRFGGLNLGIVLETNAAFSPTPRKQRYPQDDLDFSTSIETQGVATARAKTLGTATISAGPSSSVEIAS